MEAEARGPKAPLRAGSVPYLNAAPLVYGLEGRLRLEPPSRLADSLRRGSIDAALVSITEVLFADDYDLLDGPCVASDGEVFSVFLAHQVPLESVRRVHCHAASLTSVNLLRVLLAERGLRPTFESLGDLSLAGECEAVLLIGDPAIRFRLGIQNARVQVWDLGRAWQESVGLPFVYAAWALRRGVDTIPLRRELHEAAERGRREIENVIRTGTGFDEAFRRHYLTRHTHHWMGDREKAGVRRFVELLQRHVGGAVREPTYVL